MIDLFLNSSPVIMALIATTFTWFITTLGSALVFLFKKFNQNVLDSMLALASGVMLAASFWSLITPAIELSTILNQKVMTIVTIGLLIGCILLSVGDILFNKMKITKDNTNLKNSIMLILSITLHNIPEGLSIGVAFGSIPYLLDGSSVTTACLLALGIGIQNFPEGMAVSLPLRRYGISQKKSFFYGQLSAIVEPISGVIGAILAIKIKNILPFLLAFAAGAMIYVVIKELIPESQKNKYKNIMTLFTIIGFSVMMILDVKLG